MKNEDERRKRQAALKAAAKRRATYSEGELRQIFEKAQETLLRRTHPARAAAEVG